MGGSVSMIDGHIDEVLKPCPFCGSESIAANQHKMFGADVRYTIKCMKCMGEMTRTTRKKAIEAWNRRADT